MWYLYSQMYVSPSVVIEWWAKVTDAFLLPKGIFVVYKSHDPFLFQNVKYLNKLLVSSNWHENSNSLSPKWNKFIVNWCWNVGLWSDGKTEWKQEVSWHANVMRIFSWFFNRRRVISFEQFIQKWLWVRYSWLAGLQNIDLIIFSRSLCEKLTTPYREEATLTRVINLHLILIRYL